MRVYKYELLTHGARPKGSLVTALMHEGARILKVDTQSVIEPTDTLVLWAEVGDLKRLEAHEFELLATGQKARELRDEERREYVGTAAMDAGNFVVHVYEIASPTPGFERLDARNALATIGAAAVDYIGTYKKAETMSIDGDDLIQRARETLTRLVRGYEETTGMEERDV